MRWREVRKHAGVSLVKAAALADTTTTTARLFEEAGEEAIRDAKKRAALLRVYSGFSRRAASMTLKVAL